MKKAHRGCQQASATEWVLRPDKIRQSARPSQHGKRGSGFDERFLSYGGVEFGHLR
jgi:hypothetical protein